MNETKVFAFEDIFYIFVTAEKPYATNEQFFIKDSRTDEIYAACVSEKETSKKLTEILRQCVYTSDKVKKVKKCAEKKILRDVK